jgi:LPXTG-site transpeptidase (sortase) family protein
MPAGPRHPRWSLVVGGGAITAMAGVLIALASLAPALGGRSTVVAPSAAPPSTAHLPQVAGAVSEPAASAPDQLVDGVAFSIAIPALAYRSAVREGVDDEVLGRGPGHYPTTSWPGQQGTVGIAAHNVYWMSFGQLRPGDLVEIQTRRSVYSYRITGSRVTDPGDRAVLVKSPEHRLALTTCYPLWAGAFATQRLVFLATEVRPTR